MDQFALPETELSPTGRGANAGASLDASPLTAIIQASFSVLNPMPTYDYVCDKCGHQFEKFQSMKDAALTTCLKDACGQKRWGKGKVRRLMGTGAGLIFKGSGFYITDYRSENYKTGAKKDVAPAVSSGGESKSGSDSKATPAATPAKAEAKPAKAKSAAT